MELKLNFIGINENDVIATSGALCNFSNGGTSHTTRSYTFDQNKSFKLHDITGYYTFKDLNSSSKLTYDCNYVALDVNGDSTTATVGKYYHVYVSGGQAHIKECDNPDHYGYFN